MADPSVAAVEIDQTLRIARDEIERRIARYRVWAFVAGCGITLVLYAVTRSMQTPSTIVPAIYFAFCVAYAVAIKALVERIGARTWLVLTAATLDLVAAAAIFTVTRALAPDESIDRIRYPTHIAGVALSVTLMLNLLRGSRATAVWCAAVASLLYVAVLAPLEGFLIAQLVPAMLFWIMGGIGVATAAQGRRTLDNFARLQLLRRFLSPAAVERVMRESADSALSLGGQLVTVTLLSADLRGFTAMSDALAPSEVVEQLNAFHGAMLEQIDAHDGALDKFMGDGLLVVFGLEQLSQKELGPAGKSGDNGGIRAVACARAMQEALARHNGERAKRALPALKMGIGVHTGPVVAGNIGAPGRRLEFTVIGDAVNMASRLEGMTKEADTAVLVSSETARRLPPADQDRLSKREPMAMRGKAEAIKVFAVR